MVLRPGRRHERDREPTRVRQQRGKNRPNRIGVSRCRLHRVDGLDLHVSGPDAVAGTPVLDIKPYMDEFGPRGAVTQPGWATEIMRDYY
ncbi:TrmO family methyltransferase domain-containing protein [Actinoplanes sp. CA-015351]|uniref:TrmO family methyltransferase domain-containing protein n=1 Tax=Actinoplanes sp. CA-015351 TaxID=3239897 RepID=UPI003D9778F8